MSECCIAICTYRRPEISKTLKSLSELTVPKGMTFKVVVSDNDENDRAKEYIESKEN